MNPTIKRDKIRVISLFSFFIVATFLVIGRSAWIQLIGDPRLAQLAKKQFRSKILVRPRRGTITDRNGEPLAINIEMKSLAANPTKIRNLKSAAQQLSKSLGIPLPQITKKLSEKKEFVWIKRKLPEEQIVALKKTGIMASDGDLIDGFWMIQESSRTYPLQEVATSVIGSVDIDSEGIEGIELSQNQSLRGKVVSLEAIRDAYGRPAFLDARDANQMKEGEEIQLTLDASLQFESEQLLKQALFKTKARSGVVIVMNAVTGEILVMASAGASGLRRNRTLADSFEPGSTIKPILVAAALQNGFRMSDQIDAGDGQVTISGKTISEAESHEKFGKITLTRLLQVSSNVGSAKLALKLGATPFLNALSHFGLGTKSGLEFPGEVSGWIPSDPKKISALTLANLGFGQGMTITPLQMIRAYAALANGGLLVQPKLLQSRETYSPKRILSPKIAEQLQLALESVTSEGGTGQKARVDGYRIAGKTGTAQVVEPGAKTYSKSHFYSSFIGFATRVEPKIIIYTALDGPKGIYYASETAAPLFRDIFEKTANRFSIPAEKITDALAQVKSAPASPGIVDTPGISKPLPKLTSGLKGSELTWEMPDLTRLTSREALTVLEGHDFKIQIKGFGIITQQSPEPKKILRSGDVIQLTLGEER